MDLNAHKEAVVVVMALGSVESRNGWERATTSQEAMAVSTAFEWWTIMSWVSATGFRDDA